MILVTGANGNVGSEVAAALVDADEPVRALSRTAATSSIRPGVEVVPGDLDRPETLAAALAGVDAVFLLPGFRDMPGVLARIRAAGAARVVLLSGGSAGDNDPDNAISRYMARSETAVRESGLPWTFLRPVAFMSNTLRWVPELRDGDVVREPFATVRVANIDPYDIAAVAVRALLTPAHEGRIYHLSGPESLLPADRLAMLGAVLGRNLTLRALSPDEARAELTAAMPAEYVDAFFRFYVDGTLDESTVRPTVEEITGRPPRTFRQWATAHVGAFAARK
ncbi:NAD(P)H-binding protein [Virgisporangium aurantiacum]|uniref:Nucleotide-diphosphate-sugar epimerase n=1 Tax=Virgisporangium aurantiacum TaxID=175570 RepID=A0A8J3ZH68_9ACTN|nr:NAD(P)H-binding protein [Virgisporangium aurantiacum]GIJ63751.1 nucleotide-diphosphate-sugar epimerase [Virgisporangium aurantiacum]